jgi:XTP/dITP diphosphohydrolase
MTDLVLATGNPFKVKEIEPLLNAAGFDIKLQTEFFDDEVEEDGLSFLENAIKKARFASAKTGLPALADDSGLEVDALGGEPGIYSARYACDYSGNTTEAKNLDKVLENLGDLAYNLRTARYTCVAVYVEHANDPVPLVGVGHWHGEILKERRTDYGVGYDPVFWIPKLVKTASEVPLETKIQISHRTQAIKQVISQIKHRTNR